MKQLGPLHRHPRCDEMLGMQLTFFVRRCRSWLASQNHSPLRCKQWLLLTEQAGPMTAMTLSKFNKPRLSPVFTEEDVQL